MNIIILGVRIIEDSDNRGSDNRGCTVICKCMDTILLSYICEITSTSYMEEYVMGNIMTVTCCTIFISLFYNQNMTFY